MNMISSVAVRSEASQCAVQPVVSVIDGDHATRESLRMLIEETGWRARTFSAAAEFLAQPPSHVPNCLLLDAQLPDISGLELQARLTDRPETPIIFITSNGDVAMTVRAMKAGAIEFLTKPLCSDLLLGAMRHAVTLSTEILRRESQMSLLRDRYASLTSREQEVLAFVVRGYLNKQVSGELGISEVTVKAHRGKMMRKMAAACVPQLVGMASKLELKPVRPLPLFRWNQSHSLASW
jgi:FixJ family two-component response regulator